MTNIAIESNHTSLFSKVSLLLSMSMIISAAGTWLGAGITSTGAMIALAVLFVLGSIAVVLAAAHSTALGPSSVQANNRVFVPEEAAPCCFGFGQGGVRWKFKWQVQSAKRLCPDIAASTSETGFQSGVFIKFKNKTGEQQNDCL